MQTFFQYNFLSISVDTMTSPCLVCLKEVNVSNSPGLKCSRCTKYHCETCWSIMAEHCSICDRSHINRESACNNCGESTRLFQSRVCEVCEDLCCVRCSEKQNCCVNSTTNETICVHCVCNNC